MTLPNALLRGAGVLLLAVTAACAPSGQQVFRATVPPTLPSAPVYTATPTFTPLPPATATPTFTPSPTGTPTPGPTPPVQTLTPASPDGAPEPAALVAASFSRASGWSCDDFPCEDDIDGFLERIGVPPGFRVSPVGRFPGQVMQIAYGRDGLLYGTVLENGTRSGAVYRLDASGSPERYAGDFVSPLGLAFQPGSDVLYVSARETGERGGGIWRVPPGAEPERVAELPCCFQLVDNQPNGLSFGPDGYLYVGVGALTDQAEPPPGRQSQYTQVQPNEAAILRVHPHTGEITVHARGIRNAYDITFTSDGQMYATDQGLLAGPGDRLLRVDEGAHFGWPYYAERGCDRCPPLPPSLVVAPDLLPFPNRALPRGLVAYTGTQFPSNMFDSLFVTLWNATRDGQRVVRIDPARVPTNPQALAQYRPEAFVTGLIRPIDVVLAPDGSLVVADYVYGHVWRVAYEG